jgi:Domain of unknown function (DUF5122) beta-propeller
VSRLRRFALPLLHGAAALLSALICATALATGWTTTLPNGQVLNLVEGATNTASGYYLERRFGAGIRDPQFGSGGRTLFTLGSDNNPPATLQVDSAGRILVSGSAELGTGRSAAIVLRFLANGQVDLAWGQQGRSQIEASRGNASASDTLALADGQVLVLGVVEDDQDERAALWRLTDTGRLDAAFGTAGLLLATALPQSSGVSIQQGEDGTLHIALQVGRGDKTWLEVHRWSPGAPGPVRASRQEFPDDWVGPPVLARRGQGWAWSDASQPMTLPMALVAAAPESVWATPTAAAPTPRTDGNAPAGHAAVNPFNEPGAAISAPNAITLDDLAWPGLLLGTLAIFAGAFWWWWRRG